MQDKLQSLRESRPEAVEDLKKARAMGDLSENGYYRSAKFKLSSIDHDIRHFERLLKSAKVVQAIDTTAVSIGSIILVHDGTKRQTYHLVGQYEANPKEGKVSHLSPLGKALLGKCVGDIVELHAPKGTTTYKIINISI